MEKHNGRYNIHNIYIYIVPTINEFLHRWIHSFILLLFILFVLEPLPIFLLSKDNDSDNIEDEEDDILDILDKVDIFDDEYGDCILIFYSI